MIDDGQAGLGLQAPPALLPLLRALADLKRIRSAGRRGSMAERLFAVAWGRVAADEPAADIVRDTVSRALAATRLGDLDPVTLAAVGVPPDAARRIRHEAAAGAAEGLDPALLRWLLPPESGTATPADEAGGGMAPPFVALLADQPRAGATCPGRGRLMLEPPESHADHCLAVAVFAVLLAPVWGADAETVFLAALAHHLHNAWLPDAGFAGETALGAWLEPAMNGATARALEELRPGPRARIETARRILPDARTPEGRAFHAADTIDRVLQVEHHLRASGTTMDFVLRRMELVHAGPVKPFQDAVLQAVGLAA